jgi:hypothetical protein
LEEICSSAHHNNTTDPKIIAKRVATWVKGLQIAEFLNHFKNLEEIVILRHNPLSLRCLVWWCRVRRGYIIPISGDLMSLDRAQPLPT